MKRLGAIIAGGKATRFGGDKAAAILNGRPLIENVADGLSKQVDKLIVCGREWHGMDCVEDHPVADMGPLGGLNAAFRYAQQNGFDEVVTAGCDVLPVPKFPREISDGQAVYIEDNYLFGVWPVALAPMLDTHLSSQSNRSMRGWIAAIDAKPIQSAEFFHNLNTPSDVAQYSAQNSNIGIR